MYKTRQPLFTGCHGPVFAQHGCQYDVVGTAMASKASRAGNIMEAKFGPKMGHFGRSSARHVREISRTNSTANCRQNKRLVKSGHRWSARENKNLRKTRDRSKYTGNHTLRLCTREKVLLWYS